MKIPEGFSGTGVCRPITETAISTAVKKVIAALDALDFGIIASSAEVAGMAGRGLNHFRQFHALHAALAPYRYQKQQGSPVFWGNKESIKKLIEANAQ